MLDGNYAIAPPPKQQTYSAIPLGVANAVPISKPLNMRSLEPVGQSLKSREYIAQQNFREIHAKNLAPSAAASTENFIKAKAILTPVYSHNEAKTKYDMISQIGMRNLNIREKVDMLA